MSGSILVTGASGLIGRAVVHRLAIEGQEVIAISREVFANKIAAYLSGEECGLAAVASRAAAIVHLAAAVPQPGTPDDEQTAETTRQLDDGIYAAAKRTGCYVVYASGCSLYGASNDDFVNESAPIANLKSPYLIAKARGDELFAGLEHALVARISSPYGPGLKRHLVLSKFMHAASHGEPIAVWGDGRREQDFIHTSDVADFIVGALRDQWTGRVNVASGKPTTMQSLAETCAAVAGKSSPIVQGPRNPEGTRRARYSIGRAVALGWQPRVSLESGVRELLRAQVIPVP